MMVSQPSTVPATASAVADCANVAQPAEPNPATERAESAQLPKQAHRVRAVHARNLDTISGTEELIASIACAIDGPSLFFSEFQFEGILMRSSA